MYQDASRPLREDWNKYENFVRVLAKLDRSSSPGWPLCRQSPTIGDWLYPAKTIDPDPTKAEMLWNMVQDVFRGTYHHVFKCFVKPEPHTPEKAEQGRWRLILASSLPVQVAWHMTIGHLEEAFVKEAATVPSAYAFCFFGGGWTRFNSERELNGLNWCADKSAWDWNSPGWVYDAIRRLRIRLTRGSSKNWRNVLDILYRDAYVDSRVHLSTGHVYKQTAPGLMKSGLVPTISDNSIAQVLLHVVACNRLRIPTGRIRATGDDTIQSRPQHVERYVETIQKLGCVVKTHFQGGEFMGVDLSDQMKPIYPHKHLWKIIRAPQEDRKTILDAYCRNYCHHPGWMSLWYGIAERLGINLYSVEYYQFFMDHPDGLVGFNMGLPGFDDTEARHLGVCLKK